MPNGDTPSPPSASPRRVSTPPPAPDAKQIVADLRAARIPKVLEPRTDVVVQAPFPGVMRTDMEGFLDRYAADYGLDLALRTELIEHYSGIGREARRWQTLQERRSLNPQAEETMGYVRTGLGKEFIDPLLAHIAKVEDLLARILKGVSENGVGQSMSQYGVYSRAFATEIEELLKLLEKGWKEIGALSPAYTAINLRNNRAEDLTNFLANAIYLRLFTDDADAAEALLQLREKLRPFGLHDDAKSLQDTAKLGDDLPEVLIQTDVDARVYSKVEDLMHLAFQRNLTTLMDRPAEKRGFGIKSLEAELLLLIKHTFYDRHRALVKPYLPILDPSGRARKERRLDNYDPSLAGVRELLKVLHYAIRLIRSETKLKTYFRPNS